MEWLLTMLYHCLELASQVFTGYLIFSIFHSKRIFGRGISIHMGQKDFTDWNGRKRKALIRPKLVRELPLHRAGARKNPGFKTLVDRYRAVLLDLSREWCWWKRGLHDYLKWTSEGKPREHPRCVPYFGYGFGTTKKDSYRELWSMKRAKKMKKDLVSQGMYEKVLEALGPWKFREKYHDPFSQ